MTFLVSLKPDLPEQVEPTGFSIMTFLVSLKQGSARKFWSSGFSIMTFLVSLKLGVYVHKSILSVLVS